jgi:hypothetical protein
MSVRLDNKSCVPIHSSPDDTPLSADEEARCKTVFCTPNTKFAYLKNPFGLCNAPALFKKLLDQVLKKHGMFLYADDIQELLFSQTCHLYFELFRGFKLVNPDFSIPFILTTDASDRAVGKVLEQLNEDNQRYPLAYTSRFLHSPSAQRTRPSVEKSHRLVNYIRNTGQQNLPKRTSPRS